MENDVLRQAIGALFDPARLLDNPEDFGSHKETEQAEAAFRRTLEGLGFDKADDIDCAGMDFACRYGEEQYARGFFAGARLIASLLGHGEGKGERV